MRRLVSRSFSPQRLSPQRPSTSHLTYADNPQVTYPVSATIRACQQPVTDPAGYIRQCGDEWLIHPERVFQFSCRCRLGYFWRSPTGESGIQQRRETGGGDAGGEGRLWHRGSRCLWKVAPRRPGRIDAVARGGGGERWRRHWHLDLLLVDFRPGLQRCARRSQTCRK